MHTEWNMKNRGVKRLVTLKLELDSRKRHERRAFR